jgi:hypothetical protein
MDLPVEKDERGRKTLGCNHDFCFVIPWSRMTFIMTRFAVDSSLRRRATILSTPVA